MSDSSAASERTVVGQHVWSVLVVEDDPAVAELHRRLVDAQAEFSTVMVAGSGTTALQALKSVGVDLVILDLTMPSMDGMTFLRAVRREGLDVDVIVVTASRDSRTVREAMRLGALDYLVKPFTPERLRKALDIFARRTRALERPHLAQSDLDLVQARGPGLRRLPKGLNSARLEAVIGILREAQQGVTADDVGELIGASRVTARRYLEYLAVIGTAQMELEYGKSGRPRHRYYWRGPMSRGAGAPTY